jgi:hypothetical protein
MIDSFAKAVADIDSAYRSLGHTLGWRFLTGPKVTLSSDVDIGFITLNPGGYGESVDHPRASCENGNAYLTETWGRFAPGKAPLQRQVQMLFTALKAKLGDSSSLADLMDAKVMSGYFIPFRSPSIKALPLPKESLKFAVGMWEGIFASWSPKLILTIDKDSFREMTGILSARSGARRIDARRFPTGWGNFEAEAVRLSGVREDGPVTIARLPHLSRFQLFGNPARAPQLGAFLGYLAQQIQGRPGCENLGPTNE